MDVQLHRASEAERLEAFANVHDVWSRGLPLDEHVERRKQSAAHEWARWYVGVAGGRVVTSLGAYPIQFFVRGHVHLGMAIGSVHTVAEHRGHGFAPKLLEFVEATERDQGAALSVLFSDIRPEYYARLGYQECAAHYAWAEPGSAKVGGGFSLEPFDAADRLDWMMNVYDARFRDSAFAVARSRAYWENLLARRQEDRFFAVGDGGGEEIGYLRLAETERSAHLIDFALSKDDVGDLESLLRDVAGAMHELTDKRVGGWLPNLLDVRNVFHVAPRQREITMVKSLDSAVRIDDDMLRAADELLEIDHV